MRIHTLCLIGAAGLLAGCAGAPTPESKKAETPAFFTVDPATASRLTGKVLFAGKPPARKPISMAGEEVECRRLHKTPLLEEDVVVGAGGALANVFVYVKTGLEGKSFAPPPDRVRIDQSGCMFRPRVFGIRAGQTLEVSNSDPVSHNIHPIPQNNREWNQQQAPGAPNLEREFARQEVMVPVKCNIHSWMRSYIGVIDHPFFAVTGENGAFAIDGLPPGEYTLEAWHEKLGAQQQTVTLAASAAGAVEFTFKGE